MERSNSNKGEASSASMTKILNTSDYKSIWLRYSRAHQFEELKKELGAHEKWDIKKFFEKQGRTILVNALYASGSEELAFMVENVPNELIKNALHQKVLQQDECPLIRLFLLTETGLEEYGKFDDKRSKSCIKKIELLLGVDPTIKETFFESLEDMSLGRGVKAGIKEALLNTEADLKEKESRKFSF